MPHIIRTIKVLWTIKSFFTARQKMIIFLSNLTIIGYEGFLQAVMNLEMLFENLGASLWVFLPFGLFLGLLGFRMHRFSLFFIGIFTGFVIGAWIGQYVENDQIGILLGAILGMTLGIINQFLIRFSLFVVGMIGGYIVASLALPGFEVKLDTLEAMLWFAIASFAGGLLTMLFYRLLVIIMTSLIGTYFIYMGTNDAFPPEAQSWSWTLYVALIVVFILVQYLTMKDVPDPVTRSGNSSYNSHRRRSF